MQHPDYSIDAPITHHAEMRARQRRISNEVLDLTLQYGRTIRSRGAIYKVVGRKEIERFASRGVDLRKAEGVHVLLGSDGAVITTYRNNDLRKIRPTKRRHAFSH